MTVFPPTNRKSSLGIRLLCVCPMVLSLGVSLMAGVIGVTEAATVLLTLTALSIVGVAAAYGPFSPISMVMAGSTLYAIAPAIGFLTDPGNTLIDARVYFERALPLSLGYTIPLLLLYEFHKKKAQTPLDRTEKLPSRDRIFYLAAAALVGALFYLISVYIDVGLISARFDRGAQQIALSTQSRVLVILAACGSMYGLGLCIIARQAGKRYPQIAETILLLSLGVFAYTSIYVLGDRRIFLSAVAGLVSVAAFSRRASLVMLVFLAPAYVLFSTYSGLRGVPTYEWANRLNNIDVLQMVDPSRGEFGGWARIAQDVLSQPFRDVSKLTALQAPLCVVPRGLFPDRPDAPSVWYVKTFDPETAMRGGAWAFSLVIESYMNFWLFGPIVLAFVVGFFIAKFEGTAMRQLSVVSVLAFSYRSDLVSLMQQAGLTVAFLIMYSLIGRARIR